MNDFIRKFVSFEILEMPVLHGDVDTFSSLSE